MLEAAEKAAEDEMRRLNSEYDSVRSNHNQLYARIKEELTAEMETKISTMRSELMKELWNSLKDENNAGEVQTPCVF